MRYFMRLAYRGARYHGWQVQPDRMSVQQAIEEALTMVLHREQMSIVGAGRTDAGVNAAMMVAHFDVDTPLADTALAVRSLNGILPPDIAIQEIYPVADDAHARFDATSRTYHYYVHSEKSPFLYPLSWRMPPSGLDMELMNEAAARLLKHEDFTSFSKLHTDVNNNLCHITEAEWKPLGDGRWVFVITANRFLRNMVRAIVGTLVEVGRHKLTPDDVDRIIEARDRCAAGTSMPGHALFLHHISYES